MYSLKFSLAVFSLFRLIFALLNPHTPIVLQVPFLSSPHLYGIFITTQNINELRRKIYIRKDRVPVPSVYITPVKFLLRCYRKTFSLALLSYLLISHL